MKVMNLLNPSSGKTHLPERSQKTPISQKNREFFGKDSQTLDAFFEFLALRINHHRGN